MASHLNHKVYFAPMMPAASAAAAAAVAELGIGGFNDKRNRNPNWTDHEIMRFLDILQEEKVLKDLMAQRNKQVFCYVAQRMTAEGSEKTWDQCRIKLKNLKSQYRYVKDRIPNIDEVDLEDDEVLKQLVAECQGRGISPSNIKHLRYLRRFLRKTTDFASNGHHFKSGASTPLDVTSASARYNQRTPTEQDGDHLVIDDAESVSPPSTPLSSGVRLIPDSSMVEDSESSSKKRRKLSNSSQYCDFSGLLTGGSFLDGYRFIEKFNRDMMDQFLDYQRRVAASQIRWEQERYRQEQLAIEQWRQESREHEKQMFGIFCGVLSQCNAALNILLKARLDDRDNLRPSKADQSSPASSSLSQDGIKSPPSHHNSGQENNVSS